MGTLTDANASWQGKTIPALKAGCSCSMHISCIQHAGGTRVFRDEQPRSAASEARATQAASTSAGKCPAPAPPLATAAHHTCTCNKSSSLDCGSVQHIARSTARGHGAGRAHALDASCCQQQATPAPRPRAEQSLLAVVFQASVLVAGMNNLSLNNWNNNSALGIISSERLAIVSPEPGRLCVETYTTPRQAALKMFPAASFTELLKRFPGTACIDIRSELLRQDVLALLELQGTLQELRVSSTKRIASSAPAPISMPAACAPVVCLRMVVSRCACLLLSAFYVLPSTCRLIESQMMWCRIWRLSCASCLSWRRCHCGHARSLAVRACRFWRTAARSSPSLSVRWSSHL